MGTTVATEGARIVAIPVDGSGPGVELQDTGDPSAQCCLAWAWAPDDSTILGAPIDTRGDPLDHVLWDPMTGEMTPAPWVANEPSELAAPRAVAHRAEHAGTPGRAVRGPPCL